MLFLTCFLFLSSSTQAGNFFCTCMNCPHITEIFFFTFVFLIFLKKETSVVETRYCAEVQKRKYLPLGSSPHTLQNTSYSGRFLLALHLRGFPFPDQTPHGKLKFTENIYKIQHLSITSSMERPDTKLLILTTVQYTSCVITTT